MEIQTFDIDGVIFFDKHIKGVRPHPEDYIITGRSYEEAPETYEMLHDKGIFNMVFFNTIPFKDKSRQNSGFFKGQMIKTLITCLGHTITAHYEDDELQAEEILKVVDVPIILMQHNLTNKENHRQGE